MARRPPQRPDLKGPARKGPPPKRVRTRSGPLPSREEIVEFVQAAPGKIGKREIARAFNIRSNDRIGLKALLREMADEGLLTDKRHAIRAVGRLPEVAPLDVVARDPEGELVAEPVDWDRDKEGPPPRVLVVVSQKDRGHEQVPGLGDRILAHIAAVEPSALEPGGYAYEARVLRILPKERQRLLGIFRRDGHGGGLISPIDRKQLREWRVEKPDIGGAEDGELVRYDIRTGTRAHLASARIVERLGNPADQRRISLIAVHAHGIPEAFPKAVLAELEVLPPLTAKGREDLTRLPLVTIDPVDARDHDDAVWAAPDEDPANPGGVVAIVAIADVAHYVRPGSALDREALKRGNSVYFPDIVVPMLPERISNDLCSLREGELRPCLAVRMVFDAEGNKRSHRFSRATMRSAAKLAYTEAQAAIDGRPSERTAPIVGPVLRPLWHAYALIDRARARRQPLALDLPERKIVLGPDGTVDRVIVPERLAAHRLIEEFMIQANVAAAETLEARRTPLVYRIHGEPSKEKLTALRDFLETLGIKLPASGTLRPEQLNRVLERVAGGELSDLVNEVMLRSQSQAEYSPENIGHFGLNLKRYAHFTSPIRRYADLIVHRALVRALTLGPDGLTEPEIERLEPTARSISEAERRAMAAERETVDRLIALHLSGRIGAEFRAKIGGVTRSGLFVRLADTGADGFIPISTLGREFFIHDEASQALIGERSGETYRLGDVVEVRLVEAIPTAGALRFEMLSPGQTGRSIGGLPLGKRGRRRQHSRR